MTMSSDGYHISLLEIKNFRQYREAQIVFSHDPKKMFTIIRGANGAGKNEHYERDNVVPVWDRETLGLG